jgi:hypothetical protein
MPKIVGQRDRSVSNKYNDEDILGEVHAPKIYVT